MFQYRRIVNVERIKRIGSVDVTILVINDSPRNSVTAPMPTRINENKGACLILNLSPFISHPDYNPADVHLDHLLLLALLRARGGERTDLDTLHPQRCCFLGKHCHGCPRVGSRVVQALRPVIVLKGVHLHEDQVLDPVQDAMLLEVGAVVNEVVEYGGHNDLALLTVEEPVTVTVEVGDLDESRPSSACAAGTIDGHGYRYGHDDVVGPRDVESLQMDAPTTDYTMNQARVQVAVKKGY